MEVSKKNDTTSSRDNATQKNEKKKNIDDNMSTINSILEWPLNSLVSVLFVTEEHTSYFSKNVSLFMSILYFFHAIKIISRTLIRSFDRRLFHQSNTQM